jgi:hypothetical protein
VRLRGKGRGVGENATDRTRSASVSIFPAVHLFEMTMMLASTTFMSVPMFFLPYPSHLHSVQATVPIVLIFETSKPTWCVMDVTHLISLENFTPLCRARIKKSIEHFGWLYKKKVIVENLRECGQWILKDR